MKALVVLAHPEPRSFNGAMAVAACDALGDAGWEVAFADLYQMGFEPRSSRANFTSVADPDYFKPQAEETHASEAGGFAPDVEAAIAAIEACDLMIWQFPLWWFGPPAILKGWVDRAFVTGRLYGGGRMYERGVKAGCRAMLSLTTGGPATMYGADGVNGDLAGILRPMQRGMLEFIGFDVLAPQVVHAPARMSEAERAEALAAWTTRLAGVGAEPPIDAGRY